MHVTGKQTYQNLLYKKTNQKLLKKTETVHCAIIYAASQNLQLGTFSFRTPSILYTVDSIQKHPSFTLVNYPVLSGISLVLAGMSQMVHHT